MGDTGDSVPVRVWCDGCYDLVHFGHANSLRQARSLGDQLIVGVHSDEEIRKHKGPAVFTQEERVKMLRAVKWVNDVVPDAPYVTTLQTLNKYQCQFCVHGNDITTTDEEVDTYHEVKAAGRYKDVARTPGVSTTEVVSRILQTENGEGDTEFEQTLSKSRKYFCEFFLLNNNEFELTKEIYQSDNGEEVMVTTAEITPKRREIPDPEKVVYVSGAFDLFHVGHLDFLKEAAEQGDYLIIGLQTDLEVKKHNGGKYPIMNLYERTLSLLPCKYVSKVVMGAPHAITNSFMQHFNIDLVCHGQTQVTTDENGNDPYSVPKNVNKFLVVDSNNKTTTETIVNRIIQRKSEFEERNRRKEAKEIQIAMTELKV